MLLWRKTGGRRRRVWLNATFWLAIAPKAVVGVGDRVGEVVAALGDRGRELAGADDELFEEALVGVQFADEGAGPVQRGAEVLGGYVGVLAAAGVEGRLALDEVGEAVAHPSGKLLKSRSRSTGVVVSESPSVAPSSSGGLSLGPGSIET